MGSASSAVEVGAVIARKYRVERRVGEGGMGIVVAARHEALGELYAVKVIAGASDETLKKRFLREAQSAARMTSAHVVKVFDVGESEDGSVYMVMELLEGEDLDTKLLRDGPLLLRDAVGYLVQACEALAEAHGMGIVHRDIKPGNLFLTHDDHERPVVKLLDFGISKVVAEGDHATQLTQVDSLLGSPMFMAPEQVVSSSEVDARADIWSLGVTLFQLLTGEAAFDGETLTDLYTAILSGEPRSLSSLRSDLPPEIERIFLRCVHKDPLERYDTIAELVSELAPFAPEEAKASVDRIAKSVAPVARTLVGATSEASSAPAKRAPIELTLPAAGSGRATRTAILEPGYTPEDEVDALLDIELDHIPVRVARVGTGRRVHVAPAARGAAPSRWPLWVLLVLAAVGVLAYLR